jgi:hypothetical protein
MFIFVYNEILRKIPPTQGEDILTKILTDTVFATMALEDQTVEEQKVMEIVSLLLKNEESEGREFFAKLRC